MAVPTPPVFAHLCQQQWYYVVGFTKQKKNICTLQKGHNAV